MGIFRSDGPALRLYSVSAMRWAFAMLLGVIMAASTGCGSTNVRYQIDAEYGVDDPRFAQTMGNIVGPRLIGGNSITTLVNGDEIFPAMLSAIQSARRSITFETFVFLPGEVSASFAKALAEQAEAGVKVHVILDYVGGGALQTPDIARMRAAGADVRWYHQLHWWQLWSTTLKANYRTHRKLLVIDGRVGFVGGVGISDQWQGDARGPSEWRDNHYRVQGPIVAQLQSAFVDNWLDMTGQVLHGHAYFPVLEPHGELLAQVVRSSTNGADDNIQLIYLMSLAAARHTVRFATPFFVPDAVTVDQIKSATARGVRVQIIIPGPYTSSPVTNQSARAKWGELIKAGVEIYVYQPTMYHTKLMIVDDLWVSIGSANLDNRSFKLNDEANMNVLDAGFAAEQVRLFEADLQRSAQITYEYWARRSLYKKIIDSMSTLLDPLL